MVAFRSVRYFIRPFVVKVAVFRSTCEFTFVLSAMWQPFVVVAVKWRVVVLFALFGAKVLAAVWARVSVARDIANGRARTDATGI